MRLECEGRMVSTAANVLQSPHYYYCKEVEQTIHLFIHMVLREIMGFSKAIHACESFGIDVGMSLYIACKDFL